ncbi:MAG: magnesium/cobalt transporter CorA [Bacteroidota bacterium]
MSDQRNSTFSKKAGIGLAPGSLNFTGTQKMEKPVIDLITFDQEHYSESEFATIQEAIDHVSQNQQVSWLNISGLHDTSIIRFLVEEGIIHKLSGEDILHIGQRPKLDEYENYIHVVSNMFMIEEDQIENEQITFIISGNLLISFQEKPGDVFDYVRKRIATSSGQIRKRNADYLGYALLDAIVDHYFVTLEHFGEQIEVLEESLLQKPDERLLAQIHNIRRKALHIRRAIYPLREVVSRLEKLDSTFIEDETKLFVRDLYDHTIQVIETVEVFRESASSLLDLYMNSVSNRMNNVMKVLTIVSTIFIPLTFIAGVYGMNFQHMPELGFKNGYWYTLGFMVLISIIMIIFFKRKKWI